MQPFLIIGGVTAIACIVALLRRIRRLQRELAELRRTEDALVAAERDAVIGRLAARVAHEVNNPLEAIKIYIEPLRSRVQDRPEVDRGLQVIDQQVDRIARLVRGLLEFVRQRSLHRSQVQVGEVIRTVADLLQPRFAKYGKRLEVAMPAPPGRGAIDIDGVQQVLLNLLENALVAVPAGGWVRLEVAGDGDWLHLRLRDNGPGLGADPEILFRPFVSTKADGTGLGLSVARRICEAHDGWLRGSNHPEGGALFEVALRLQSTVVA
jgi:C4-dicarboxylate-specific signal transduction histidine kinase